MPPESDSLPALGQTIGQYRLLEQVGRGGMGVVYRARDERLQRDVAIKVLMQGLLATDTARRRFRREALALSKLSHPNIATIHDFDTHQGIDFLVMEYIPGSTLTTTIAGGPLSEREILHLGAQLASALAVAHENGIVHRDLKPGNLRVLPDGRLKVLDFGLARSIMPDTEMTTDTAGDRGAGTLSYMAPEQHRGEEADHRSDLYAAGVVLYEMATGRHPFAHVPRAGLISAILSESPAPPSTRNPRVPKPLDNVIMKALDKDPALRYQSARELAVDLARIGAPPSLAPMDLGRERRRRRRHFLVASGLAVALALVGWVVHDRWRKRPPFQPRDWALIADFDNRTGDTSLDHAVREGFTIQLQQSRYVNLVSREQIFDALRRMRRTDLNRVDEATGLEICRREGIPLLLSGGIHRRGQAVLISVRGILAKDEAVVLATSEQFTREEEVFDRVDKLARRVREALGEASQAAGPPLAKVTTPSLAALSQYSRAVDAKARGNVDEVLPLLESALELDPDFAMAHRLVARVYVVQGNREKELEHLGKAYALRQNVNDRERHFIEASYYRGQGAYEKALDSLATLASLYPDDIEAHNALALAYRDAGSIEKSVAELENVVKLNPHDADAYSDLVLQLARLDRNDRAMAAYDQAGQSGLQGPALEWGHGMALLGQGRIGEARQQFARMRERGGLYEGVARLYLAAADTYEGKFGAAVDHLYAGIRVDQRAHNRSPELLRRYLLARIFLLCGQPDRARREIGTAVGPGPETLSPDHLRRSGTVHAWLKDLTTARRLLAQLDAVRTRTPSSYSKSCYDNLAGEIALAEGKVDEAVESFLGATAEYERFVSHQGLARAYTAQRDWPKARHAWQQVLEARGQVFQSGFPADLVLAQLSLGRVLRQMNDVAAARTHYRLFLEAWDRADDLAIRREAIAESQQLEK